MTLRVQDFTSTIQVGNVDELETALQRRFDGVNSFWLSHSEGTKPSLSILVRDDLACLHYFPDDSHPGFSSIGEVARLKPSGTTIFYMDNPDQEQEILNTAVIHFVRAIEVAREFFACKDLPSAIKWFEL